MKKIIPLLLMLSQLAFANTSVPVSSAQGELDIYHDTNHQQNIENQFYIETSDGLEFSPEKTAELLERVKQKHEEMLPSFYMSTKVNFIERHNYSDKKASKKAKNRITKDARGNFPFIYLENELSTLIKDHESMTAEQLRDKTALLTIIYETIEFPLQTTIYESTVRAVKNLAKPFYTVQKNETAETQASNLMLNGEFLSRNKIGDILSTGDDLSLVNPPNSVFWSNTDIEAFDANSEIHRGKSFFPVPDQVFVYDRMGTGNIKIKADYYPTHVKDVCQTEEDNKNMTFRLGQETNNHLIATNIARAIGYPYIPHAKRKKVIMYLCETSFETFLSQWNRFHQNQGSFFTYGKYLSDIHAVELNELALEAYPGDDENKYRKVGNFRTQSMGLRNRREIRAQVVFNALIALVDAKEHNLRLDFFQNDNDVWEPNLFISDLGRSLGFYLIRTHGSVNQFFKSFTTQDSDEVRIWWDHQGYDPAFYSDITLSDARWIARRLARLSDSQIDDIVEQTHHIAPVKALYKNKLKQRITDLVFDLGLTEKVNTDFRILSDRELYNRFPGYISPKGFLTEKTETVPDTNTRPLGFNPTITEILTMGIMNQFFSAVDGALEDQFQKVDSMDDSSVEAFGTTFDTLIGVRLSSKRDISLNPEKSNTENRLQVKDTMTISIPLGLLDRKTTDSLFDLNLPIGGYYTYQFDYYFSVNSIKEATTTDFFKRLVPWRAGQLQQNLKTAEGLHIKHFYGLTLGGFGASLNDHVGFEFSPLKYENHHLKSSYIYKPTSNLVEVAVYQNEKEELSSAIALDLGVSFSNRWSRIQQSGQYTLFRFFDSENDISEQEAINNLIMLSVDDPSSELGKTYIIKPETIQRTSEQCFFLWCRYSSNKSSYVEIEHGENEWLKTSEGPAESEHSKMSLIGNRKIIISERTKSSDRDFARVWNDDVGLGVFEGAANLGFNILEEGISHRLRVEAVWDEENETIGNFNIQAMVIANDNLLTQSELEDWTKEFNRKVSCRKSKDDYFDIRFNEGIDYYSPVTSTMLLQINQKGLNQVLADLPENRRLCKSRCLSRYDKLVDTRIQSAREAKRYVDNVRKLLTTVLGSRFKNLGCLRKTMKKKNYWLITEADSVLSTHSPIAISSYDYFSKEIGRYQGPGVLQDFMFNTHYSPSINRGEGVYEGTAVEELLQEQY